jgi:hypothetical protein
LARWGSRGQEGPGGARRGQSSGAPLAHDVSAGGERPDGPGGHTAGEAQVHPVVPAGEGGGRHGAGRRHQARHRRERWPLHRRAPRVALPQLRLQQGPWLLLRERHRLRARARGYRRAAPPRRRARPRAHGHDRGLPRGLDQPGQQGAHGLRRHQQSRRRR